MRRVVLILISVLTVLGTQAQSKKKINQQLLAEFAAVQRTADSIEIIQTERRREIKNLGYALEELNLQMSRQTYEEATYRSEIRKKHAAISAFGFDANTLVSLTELDALPSPMNDKKFGDRSIWENRPFVVIQKPQMQDIADLKIKVQNEILQTKIAEYKTVNEKNKVLLGEDQAFLSDLKRLKTDYVVSLETYQIFNKELATKVRSLSVKEDELVRIKREEERLKKQQEIDATNKAKSKKSKDFDPPVFVENDPFDQREKQRKVESYGKDRGFDSFDYEVAPPTPTPKEEKRPAPEILEVVEVSAEFPGGRTALLDYLAKNMKMPQTAIDLGIYGKVYLRFVVAANGQLSDVFVQKGIDDCPDCDTEALRLVKEMPNWIPAKNDGKAVKSWNTLPVTFKNQ